MGDSKSREIILDAAAILVQEHDIAALALEDIAEAADLPLDAVRGHFPGLDDLVTAVAARMYRTFVERIELELGSEEGAGAWTRAYIRACVTPEARHDFPRIGRALLSTVTYKPALIAAIRDAQPDMLSAMERDGLDPMVVYTIRAALEGLFLAEMFGITVIPDTARDRFIEHLSAMTRTGP